MICDHTPAHREHATELQVKALAEDACVNFCSEVSRHA